MQYNIKRALGISLVMYIITFIVSLIVGSLSGQDMSSMNNISASFWYAGMVTAVILSALFTTWYLANKNIVASVKTGALFGLTAAALSFVLDLVLFSVGNAGGAAVDLGLYFGDFRYWIIIILVIATAAIIGWRKMNSK